MKSNFEMGSNFRLLMNAQPFGFNPAVAVASLAPLLHQHGITLAYIGQGHTLDLQRSLPYRAIYDTTNLSQPAIQKLLTEHANEYDAFFTAMDPVMTELAQKAGLPTIMYDAITWFRPIIQPAIARTDLYVAQRFFGVEERIRESPEAFPKNSRLIAPVVEAYQPAPDKHHVLLNMGGLANPYWTPQDTVRYARFMLQTVSGALPARQKLVVTTSSAVAAALDDPRVKTRTSRADMLDVLAHTRYAFMTPGLGNIYDGANFDIPTMWLPPAHGSQGQQLEQLIRRGYSDAAVEWRDIGGAFDHTKDQPAMIKAIARALKDPGQSQALQQRLSALFAANLPTLAEREHSKTVGLLQRFGTNGMAELRQAVLDYVKQARLPE